MTEINLKLDVDGQVEWVDVRTSKMISAQRYLPEVTNPGPVFQPGQIVEVVGKRLSVLGWHGIVVKAAPREALVEFGKPWGVSGRSTFTFHKLENLKLIHEVS